MQTDGLKLGAIDEGLKQGYEQWEKVHTKMKDSPPPDGRDYLRHAASLLVFLDGLAEVHPVAKAVVSTFKVALMYEQDRRENDARVTAVFLAQTDVMRVLLDVSDLANRRRSRLDAENLRTTATLDVKLTAIQEQIKFCSYSLETYYKESRFVKFWKAQDWKKRILGHIGQFNKLRIELQQILSIQVASGVEDLAIKLDNVLTRLYAPTYDWEKDLDVKTRGVGNPSLWIQNTDTLQSFIFASKDPSFPLLSPSEDNASLGLAAEMQISQVKEELQLSLDALCAKNVDMFELKLNFHTRQMEKTVVNSAHHVIQSLSGPSGRLFNEDLRQLWKEMDWIFCVENKFFVSALFEFYLDLFSSGRNISDMRYNEDSNKADTKNDDETRSEAVSESDSEVNDIYSLVARASVSVPKFSFLSRLGNINHPDSWTLEYMSLHGQYITQAIDNDSSGFIRISEANAFTNQIPKGWSLPQWCAYSAAGWAYECRIYRRRISKMMDVLTEMQAKVLDSNRGYLVTFSVMNFYVAYQAFTREPTGQKIPPIVPELRELVKQKVLAQDTEFRGNLEALKWTIEDESTLHLLYGETAPEKYILQFCTLMMEQWLGVIHVCRTSTVDIEEWLRLASAFRLMREVIAKRVSELGARFEDAKSAAENIASYYGGIWSFVPEQLNWDLEYDTFRLYTRQELTESYLSDVAILKDFPLSAVSITSPYLRYTLWEEYIKDLEVSSIPSTIPKSWNQTDEPSEFEELLDRTDNQWADFPPTGWGCDRCKQMKVKEKRYRCLSPECPDFDFCQTCHNLPESDHSVLQHKFDHPLLLCGLFYMPEQEQKIAFEVEMFLEQLQQEYNALQRSQSHSLLATSQVKEDYRPEKTQFASKVEAATQETEKKYFTVDKTQTEDVLRELGSAPHTEGEYGPHVNSTPQDTEALVLEDTEGVHEQIDHVPQETPLVMPIEVLELCVAEERALQRPADCAQSTEVTGERDAVKPALAMPLGEEASQTEEAQHEKEKAQLSQREEGVQQSKDFEEPTTVALIDKSTASLAHGRFVCGRCVDSISLESEFFVCIGHLCQNYYICAKCSQEHFDADEDDHQWWHSLFALRKSLIVGSSATLPSTGVIAGEEPHDTKLDREAGDRDLLHVRMSKLEERLTTLDANVISSNSSLEMKVEKLEAKMDDILLALKDLLGSNINLKSAACRAEGVESTNIEMN